MPVDGIDAQIQSLISGAQLETQKKIDHEDEADHARKLAEKKIALKKERLKGSNFNREVFRKQSDLHNKMRQIMGGAAGKDAANALNEWQSNHPLIGLGSQLGLFGFILPKWNKGSVGSLARDSRCDSESSHLKRSCFSIMV